MTTKVPTLLRQMSIPTRRTPTWQALMPRLVATVPQLLVWKASSIEVPRFVDLLKVIVHVTSVWAVRALSVIAKLPVANEVSAHWRRSRIWGEPWCCSGLK
jgi:hypothetical protein